MSAPEPGPSKADAENYVSGLIAMSEQGRWHELVEPQPDDQPSQDDE